MQFRENRINLQWFEMMVQSYPPNSGVPPLVVGMLLSNAVKSWVNTSNRNPPNEQREVSESVMITGTSAYRFFPGTCCMKLLEEGFQNCDEQKKARAFVNTYFFHTELFTHSATNMHFASGILYMLSIRHINHSSMPSLQRAHQIIRLGTRSKLF